MLGPCIAGFSQADCKFLSDQHSAGPEGFQLVHWVQFQSAQPLGDVKGRVRLVTVIAPPWENTALQSGTAVGLRINHHFKPGRVSEFSSLSVVR